MKLKTLLEDDDFENRECKSNSENLGLYD